MNEEAPFKEMPSGIAIARYFWEETEHRNNGAEGIDLYRDGADYSYLWVQVMIDHDMWESYLLDIRTRVGVPTGELGETRDYLFVMAGGGGMFEVQWENKPIRFDAPTDEHRARDLRGLNWMGVLTEKAMEDFEKHSFDKHNLEIR